MAKKYKVLKVVELEEGKKVTVGMWPGKREVYFTVEGLEPGDVLGQDVEFGINLAILRGIVKIAEFYG